MVMNQNDRYYSIMHHNVGDKMRMLDHLPESTKTVIDVGGGDGSLMRALHPSIKTIVLDPSDESVRRAEQNGTRAIKGYSDQLFRVRIKADAIVACSSLHEIFSYGNSGGIPRSLFNVRQFLCSASDALRPGGRLIIRDSVAPEYDELESAYMRIPDALEWVDRFNGESPYNEHRERPADIVVQDIEAVYGEDDWYTSSPATLLEFLLTWTWGPDSWEREIQELHAPLSLSQLTELASEAGLVLVRTESYVQNGVVEHLRDAGVQLSGWDLPATKAIWVFEKPGADSLRVD